MNFDSDLENNAITIYLQGGIVSVIKNNDLEFAKECRFKYRDFGCMAPENISYYKNYNIHVFNYLLNKYGKNVAIK